LASVEFAINNKTYLTTKVSLFIVDYRRELRIGIDIRQKEGRESDRICEKNKKGAERSRSSIEKNTGRNEVASR